MIRSSQGRRLNKYLTCFVLFAFVLETLFVPIGFNVPVAQAQSAFNKKINYQGKLMDSAGAVVEDDGGDLKFKLYTV